MNQQQKRSIKMNLSQKQIQTLKFKTIFEAQKAAFLLASKQNAEELALKSEDLADEADLSSAEVQQEMSIKLRGREALFIKKINESLQKIQAGTFGVCEECEEDIEASRLEVRPTAALCICCKEKQEAMAHRMADGKGNGMPAMKPLRIA